MSNSVRKNILQALVTKFTSVVEGQPPSDPYPFAFSLVTRSPVQGLKIGQRAVLGIYPEENTKTPTAGIVMDNMMGVRFELWLNKNLGEDLPDLLEDGLAVIERRLMEDQTLGRLCFDINVTGLDTDIDGPIDNNAAAVVTATFRYRHHRDNPSLEVGE